MARPISKPSGLASRLRPPQVIGLLLILSHGLLYVLTITYPEMEHLAKPLHHAMKTALFPLFFYPVVTKILNKDSKKSPIKWTLCM